MASSATSLESGLRAIVARIAPGAEGVAELRALSGGASQETWAFLAGGPGVNVPLVLRRAGPGAQERSRNSAGLDTEAALIRLAAQQGVPVPNVRYVLRPEDGIGAGFIMDRIEGETIARKILRDKEFDAVRPRLARECGQHIARIHQIDAGLLPPLKTTTAADELEGYYSAYRRLAGSARRRPVFELAFRWLRERLPRQNVPMTLVHGDFRHGNLMIGPDGVRAVLDWELAHIGDPMKDLGWICTNSWRFGNIDLPVGGFGTREELFAGYEEAGGKVDPDRVKFWEVFGSLKWGVMCEEMVATFVSGADPSVERAAIGRRVSETEIDLMRLLAPSGPAHAAIAPQGD